jgi:hypothetical protein
MPALTIGDAEVESFLQALPGILDQALAAGRADGK